jgi:hypothetical protein
MMAFALAFALQAAPPPSPGGPAIVTTTSGLRFQVLEPGTGRRPEPGDAVRVTYEGRLADGRVFDSAVEPAGILVSNTVPGFREALLMMKSGRALSLLDSGAACLRHARPAPHRPARRGPRFHADADRGRLACGPAAITLGA